MAVLSKLVPDPAVGRVIPLLAKTIGNVADMEAFFERWWQLADHAVIDRFPTGGTGNFALAADASPVPMDPPWTPPRPTQAKRRLTVLADGTPCLCHQDWRGRAALGGPEASLAERWSLAHLPAADPAWGPDDSPVCRRCFDFLTLCRERSMSGALAIVLARGGSKGPARQERPAVRGPAGARVDARARARARSACPASCSPPTAPGTRRSRRTSASRPSSARPTLPATPRPSPPRPRTPRWKSTPTPASTSSRSSTATCPSARPTSPTARWNASKRRAVIPSRAWPTSASTTRTG